MSLLNNAAAKTDNADLVILANVETIRDQSQPATASAVASLIGGAPVREVAKRLHHLAHLGCLEGVPHQDAAYALSELGAELLRRDLIGWSPSKREDRRREMEMLYRSARRS